MRLLSGVLAVLTISGGCASQSYRVSADELNRLATLPPQVRSQAVRVDQEIHEADVPPAERIDGSTEVVFVPNINISGGIRYDHPTAHGVGGGGGGGVTKGGGGLGQAGSGKDAAIAVIVIAAVAMFAVAAIEGSRYDGTVNLHPMHPLHLFGRDGGYTVIPMAWLDPQTAAWADHGVVKSTEGPWREVERAPLWREGPTYVMYGGDASSRSALGGTDFGPAFMIQGGVFFTEQIGVLASLYLGWRNNSVGQVLFDTRSLLELHYLPVAAGPFHAGVFGGGGFAYRYEDGVDDGNNSSIALTGGALFELALHTRVSLVARLGMTQAHADHTTDAMLGLAVY
jgi:hypothetical protein